MTSTILLPPVLFAAGDDGEDEAPEETSSWEQELNDSNRPSGLKRAILAFVAAIAAVAERVATDATSPLGSGQRATPAGGGTAIADQADRASASALVAYDKAVAELIATHAPKIAHALTAWITDRTGQPIRLSTAKVEADLAAKVQQYLTGSIVDLRKAANVAIVNWHVVPGGTEATLREALARILDGATWQAKRVVITEVQNAYKDLFRDAMARSDVRKIERIAMPTACDFCKALAGVHWFDDPDLYDTHPHCECLWEAADPGASVDFSLRPCAGPVGASWLI